MGKKIFLIIGAIAVFIGLFSWNLSQSHKASNRDPTKNSITQKSRETSSSTSKNSDKILIVFFSRSGTNYPDTNLKIGHTQRIANEIAKVTGGNKYQIQTVKAYPKNYDKTVDQAENEQQRNARPRIQGPLPDLSKYDTIFFGYPIWWNDIPMAVQTFMDQADLNNKTIIPFSTNEGSGWGDSLSTIKKKYPQATMKKGFEIEGQQADHSQQKIDSWLNKLGYGGK